MPWLRRGARIPSTALEERRVNEELSLISRRLKLCDDTLRADPANTDALFTKGVFLAKIREFRRALQCIERVVDIDPSYPGLWRTKAVIHVKLGETKEAEACRRRASAEAV
jgi:tetratricopeptide (TPR) repeat protein